MNKQETGFKFGIKPTTFVRLCGELEHNGRSYKLALIEADGHRYYSIRLYNSHGKFIKQLMFEPAILNGVIDLLVEESNR